MYLINVCFNQDNIWFSAREMSRVHWGGQVDPNYSYFNPLECHDLAYDKLLPKHKTFDESKITLQSRSRLSGRRCHTNTSRRRWRTSSNVWLVNNSRKGYFWYPFCILNDSIGLEGEGWERMLNPMIDERLLRGLKDYRPGKKFTSVYHISSSDIIYDIGRPNE